MNHIPQIDAITSAITADSEIGQFIAILLLSVIRFVFCCCRAAKPSEFPLDLSVATGAFMYQILVVLNQSMLLGAVRLNIQGNFLAYAR